MFIDLSVLAIIAIVFVFLLVKIVRLYSKIHTLQRIIHKLEIDGDEERFPDTDTGDVEGRD